MPSYVDDGVDPADRELSPATRALAEQYAAKFVDSEAAAKMDRAA